MKTLSLNKPKPIVGLDIEAGSIAATEVRAGGGVAPVARHGVAALEPGAFRDGEVTDPEALGAALKSLFAEHKLSRNVRVGVANQRVAVRTLRLPALDNDAELETAIRFQAQDHIPMPLDQAVLDWRVVGRASGEAGERQVEVVAVAARRDMVTSLMSALRSAGLRPLGIDHSAFGMIRALSGAPGAGAGTPPPMPADASPEALAAIAEPSPGQAPSEAPGPARLHCSLADMTNLAVAAGDACLFTRIGSFGIEGIAQRLAERRELTLEQARRWLVEVGLLDDLEGIEGDPDTVAAARQALVEGSAKLAEELRLSLEFYAAQEGAIAVDGVVACGPGTTIPGLVESLQGAVGLPFEIGRPLALADLDRATAARLTLSYGLALER